MSNLIGKQVVLTLKCSLISTVPKHRDFARTLGLKKPGDQKECEYTANVQTPVLTGNYDDAMPVAFRKN